MYKLWNMLAEMKSDAYEWVELSHSMNNDSPVWSGIPAGSVEVSKTVFDWGNPMLECLIQTFKFPGQYGTHIDFPGHFVKDMPLSEKFGAQQMLFPLCVIDITAKVAEDVHYAVTVEDIKAYEAEYGPIPDGAFVALRTDWYKNWPDMDKLSGIAADGSENFSSKDGVLFNSANCMAAVLIFLLVGGSRLAWRLFLNHPLGEQLRKVPVKDPNRPVMIVGGGCQGRRFGVRALCAGQGQAAD